MGFPCQHCLARVVGVNSTPFILKDLLLSACFSKEDVKKKLCMGFPCLDCLARVVGVNFTPFILKYLVLKSSLERSADLDSHVSAINMTVFYVECFRVKLLLSTRDSMYLSITCTSHVLENLASKGLSLNAPFISRKTRRC